MIEVLRMNKSILNKLFACSLLFWLAGCAENKYTKTIEQLCPPAATKAAGNDGRRTGARRDALRY